MILPHIFHKHLFLKLKLLITFGTNNIRLLVWVRFWIIWCQIASYTHILSGIGGFPVSRISLFNHSLRKAWEGGYYPLLAAFLLRLGLCLLGYWWGCNVGRRAFLLVWFALWRPDDVLNLLRFILINIGLLQPLLFLADFLVIIIRDTAKLLWVRRL